MKKRILGLGAGFALLTAALVANAASAPYSGRAGAQPPPASPSPSPSASALPSTLPTTLPSGAPRPTFTPAATPRP